MPNEAASINLRPLTSEDEAFLYELYASTRAEELAAWGWNAVQQDAFLRMQFKAQQMSYQAEDVGVETKIILLEGKPVGRIIVARTESEIQLTDIALLTEHRSKGIGSALIKGLFDEATLAGKAVRLHVLKTNRAMRLYERLGFRTINERGMHLQMQWTPHEQPDLT